MSLSRGRNGAYPRSRGLTASITARLVVLDLRPVDLGAGDGKHSPQGLEGGVTHGVVARLQRLVEVGLGLVDGLHNGVSQTTGILENGKNKRISNAHASSKQKNEREKKGGILTLPVALILTGVSVLSWTLPSS